MKINLKEKLKEILISNQPMKLIKIVNKAKELGFKSSNDYMAIYICLRENKHLFERVSTGFYKLRSAKETSNFLALKIDPEEELNEIYSYVNKNPNKTPAQIHDYLNKSGIYITYKAVCAHLSKADFNKQLGIVNTKNYTSKYFTNK
jgi:hypothetical protein